MVMSVFRTARRSRSRDSTSESTSSARSSEHPSGNVTATSNSLVSSRGTKSLPTMRIREGVEASTPTVTSTTSQRCRSENRRQSMEKPSTARQTKPDLLEWAAASSALRNREQSMGVIVNETNMLIRIETDTT